jgi:hypothetical protein
MSTKKQAHSTKHTSPPKVRVTKHGIEILPSKSNLNIKDARGILRGIDTTVTRDKS